MPYNSGTMVKQLTHDPKFKGSNPAFTGTKGQNKGKTVIIRNEQPW
jgi:hypothetical protein